MQPLQIQLATALNEHVHLNHGPKARRSACNECRRQKMKCKMVGQPPCEDCKQLQRHCTFDKPHQNHQKQKDEDRFCNLENQIHAISIGVSQVLQRLDALITPNYLNGLHPPFQTGGSSPEFDPSNPSTAVHPHQPQYQGVASSVDYLSMAIQQASHINNPSEADSQDKEGNHQPSPSRFLVPRVTRQGLQVPSNVLGWGGDNGAPIQASERSAKKRKISPPVTFQNNVMLHHSQLSFSEVQGQERRDIPQSLLAQQNDLLFLSTFDGV